VSPNVDTWDTWVSGAYANVKVSDGHVTELDVYANNLAGTTDMAMVCDLPYLDKLRVRTNVNLNLSIPTCIGALSQLTSFNLYFNRLAGTIPT